METVSSTSSGTLICASSICVAFIISYLLLRQRRKRRLNVRDQPSLPLCKHCHQVLAFTQKYGHTGVRQEDIQTKGWTCPACSGYNGATEMSSGGSEEDLSDLEIQQTLGSLAIGQTDVADRTRASPNSWLHLIEDMKLINKAQHTNSDRSVGGGECFRPVANSSMADLPCNELSDGAAKSPSSAFTTAAATKPLIHPARLKVRKRRLSISSATAALNLAGNGWGFGGHVTEKTNSDWSTRGERVHWPSLSLADRNFANGMTMQQNSKLTHQSMATNHLCTSGRNSALRFEPLSTTEKTNAHRHDMNGLNISGVNSSLSSTTDHHDGQSLPHSDNCQPRMKGVKYSTVVNSNGSDGRTHCGPMAALLLLSLSANVLLMFLLMVCVYKPSAVSAIL